MEIWDLYDINRQKVDKTHQRGVPVPEGCYHLVVHAWIQNDKGEVLLSKRHPDKPYGNLWECTGGSVLAGETSLEGAIREVKEELGLDLSAAESELYHRGIRNVFHSDYWYFQANAAIEDLIFQKGEVIDAKWVDEKAYLDMLKNNEIVPTIRHFWGQSLS